MDPVNIHRAKRFSDAFYDIAMSPLLVSYTVEILPFNLRAKGMMLMK